MYTLVVDNLSIIRGGIPIYETIHRVAESGICWTLVGPNGAGKTTFLRHIAGLISGGGTICWQKTGALTSSRPALAFLAASPMVKESFTVGEMLDFYRSFGGSPDLSLDDAASLWHLSFLFDTPVADLSAGQKQRLALTRLQLDPRPIWLLDEPYAHLDGAGVLILNNMIDGHLKKGGFLIMASHISPPHGRVLVDFGGHEIE